MSTTINGVTFNMETLRPVATHRNVPNEELGSDESFINDMGYSGLVVHLTGFETTLAKYDEVIAEFMKTGAQTLVYRTGWQLSIHSTRLVPLLDIGIVDNWFPYELIMITSTPYRDSTSETTRTKSVTTNNQEWSADNSANDIDTDGSVDAVPDIQVTGNSKQSLDINTTYDAPATQPSGLTWDGANVWSCDGVAQKIYKHNVDMTVNTQYNSPSTEPSGLTWDGANVWSCDYDSDKIYKHNVDMTVNTTYDAPGTKPSGLTWDGANIWSCDRTTGKIYKHNVDMTVNTTYDAPGAPVPAPSGLAWDGLNIWSCDYDFTEYIYKHNADMTVFTSYAAPGTYPFGLTWDGANIWSCDLVSDKIYKQEINSNKNIDIEIYNTTDSTVICQIGNDILYTAIHRINADGTGTVDYDDDFSTGKWEVDSTYLNVTPDTDNNEIDIADDGYIYWKCDAKGVISGIPTHTSRINITAGAPTIQISIDAATWYDIKTAIVDDVDTVYELDATSLSLKGETLFYWRYDCVKAAAATCSIKSFELDVAMHTIDFEHPKISESGVSTFRCDQDAASGMACEVSLIYRDRSWVG